MAGWYRQALDLDGTNDMIDFQAPASLQITDHLGVSIWVECGAQSAVDYIIARWEGASDKSWAIIAGLADPRKLTIFFSDTGAYDAAHAIYWTTTDQVLPAFGWAHIFLGFASGTVTLKVDNVEITAFTKTYDAAIVALAAVPASRLRIGRSSAGWAGKVTNACITDTAVPSAADVTFFYSGGPSGTPGDPLLWTPAGGAALVSSWLWDGEHTYPDILDRTASGNDGTMYNMAPGDIVPTLWPGMWAYVERTFVHNRATRISDGVRTTWASSYGPDIGMVYHPEVVVPAAYTDFVILGGSYA